MKNLLIILAFVPFFANAQFPVDSIVGCYSGIFKFREEPDTVWTTIEPDTMYVYNIDTVNYNSVELVSIGWMLYNSINNFYYEGGYIGICTIGFDFKECSDDKDAVIHNVFTLGGEQIIFFNNDSIFFVQRMQPGQFAMLHFIWFGGKKYSSTVPDSIINMGVPQSDKNKLTVNIYPNPVKEVLNIKFKNEEKSTVIIS